MRVRILNFTLAFLSIALIFYFSFHQVNYHWDWSAIYKYRQKFIQGWFTTILISIAALGLSVCIGLFFALGQRSPFLPLRYFSKLYVEVVRGTPLLVQILIFFYVVTPAFGVPSGYRHLVDMIHRIAPGFGDPSDYRYLVGVLTLSFFSGAYLSEIIRAGIESVGKSQLESAKAIGLTRIQTYRHIVFPQALRQTLPPLAGQFVSLIKDSSLLSIISISEFTLNAQEVNSYTFSTLESYIPLAVGYLILTLPISLWTRHLERRHQYET